MSATSMGGAPMREALHGELEQLQLADPARFRQVMAEVAHMLLAAACELSGFEACTLARRAGEFLRSAQTGLLPDGRR